MIYLVGVYYMVVLLGVKMKNMMKKNLLLVIFFLVCVEVVESVVYSWIMSVNLVDMDNSEENLNDNRIKGNLIFWVSYCLERLFGKKF